ncbi:NAD(P)H nitroreductase [Mycobacterium sp. ACS4331]|uniref:Acg family FMN-binding oxidoreductase n=1 Tax=Mycobacterium sp. ACS4331 TaxID=1834121 RepID=UPI0007FCAB92|nr:NAD(P)H nitroreductase [Mycobacterium sp. ACS4331]OBF14212.1 NAD(P)H nitroreductase [Mycobacterium sp. ACS4331]
MNRDSVDTDLIKQAVTVASRAPSLHNSQPWLWIADGAELQLHLDRSRIIRHTDRGAREALISCGAVLDHLRIAMAAAGWQSFVERLPNPSRPTHLASLDFRRAESVAPATRDRANAILRRRTDRLPLLAPSDWAVLESVLRELVDGDAVRLDVIDDELRPELVAASRLDAAIRRNDADYTAELEWWTGPFELDEGIPRRVLVSAAEADHVEMNRAFPVSRHGDRRSAVSRDHATILMLSTPADTPSDALAAGEALSTVLLECTVAGLATCTVTHLTELESGRALLSSLISGTSAPQVLIRVGTAPPRHSAGAATPRRQLTDILRFQR